MSLLWAKFSWNGHHRGTLYFTIWYNRTTKVTTYNYESDSSEKHNLLHNYTPVRTVLNERESGPRTLYETIYDIFETCNDIKNSYEHRPCKETFEEFAWNEFLYEGDESYLEEIGTRTFEGKISTTTNE